MREVQRFVIFATAVSVVAVSRNFAMLLKNIPFSSIVFVLFVLNQPNLKSFPGVSPGAFPLVKYISFREQHEKI